MVQPGVDMGNAQVFGYDKAKAAALSEALAGFPGSSTKRIRPIFSRSRAL